MKKIKLRNKKTGAITFTDDYNYDHNNFEVIEEIRTAKSFQNKIKHS